MNNLPTETIKEILAGAPNGATHYAQGMHYLAFNKNNDWMRFDSNGFDGAKWFAANDFKLSYIKSFHNLNDLREILALREQVPQWISVEDGLPEYGKPVLLKINNIVQHITYQRDGADEFTSDWFEPYYFECKSEALFIFGSGKSIDWMPLPQPPQEKSK